MGYFQLKAQPELVAHHRIQFLIRQKPGEFRLVAYGGVGVSFLVQLLIGCHVIETRVTGDG